MKFIETVKKMLPGCAIALVIAVAAKLLEQLEESAGLHLIGASVIAMFIGMIVNRVVDPSMNDLVRLDGVPVLAYIPTDPQHAANDIRGKSVFELPEDSNIMVGVHEALHNLGIF